MSRARLYRAFAGVLVLLGALGTSFSCNSADSPSATNLTPPHDIDDELMHTPEGNLPILIAVPNGPLAVGIVYDRTLSDPITDWGNCLELARRCYYSVPSGQPITGCISGIRQCGASDRTKGGEGCCPAQCIADFEAAVKGGASDDDAVNATILQGACVAGFLDAGGGSR
jgi:hypothetical protein